ncbi:MAG TPA: hypothetical protein VFC30_09685 [Solirubrobacteraceae bacterium]|nr:hypothetical protein [Solirubrobacteraceae bacterium]
MIGRRRQDQVEAPTSDIRVEDRRASADEPRGSRRFARLVVDYAGDTDRCMRAIAELTEEYERYVESEHAVCPDCPVVRSGPFVVYSMLEWKAIYGDGRLGHWTVGDIHEYLLEHFPRKVSADHGLLEDTPTCVRDFVYFMSDRGTLAGDDSGVLADAAEEVFDEFLAANRDRRNWGLAKQMLRGGAAIVNEDDDRYVHLATFPPMGVEPPRATASAGGRGAAARRDKRKASRAARKRNRR